MIGCQDFDRLSQSPCWGVIGEKEVDLCKSTILSVTNVKKPINGTV